MSLERMFELAQGLRETAVADAAFGEPREERGLRYTPSFWLSSTRSSGGASQRLGSSRRC